MKKLVLVFACVAGMVGLASAQSRFGVKAGYNSSTWSGDLIEKDEQASRNGFHVGLIGEWGLGKSFFFQPQLLYVNKGTAVKHEDHKDQYSVNSIDVPLNFVWKSSGEKAKFFAGTGPQLGLNISASEEHDGETEDLSIGNESTDDLKPLDFGWNFLAGIEFKNNIFLSANYSLGLANQNPASSATAKSNYFGVSVGYFFGGKKSK